MLLNGVLRIISPSSSSLSPRLTSSSCDSLPTDMSCQSPKPQSAPISTRLLSFSVLLPQKYRARTLRRSWSQPRRPLSIPMHTHDWRESASGRVRFLHFRPRADSTPYRFWDRTVSAAILGSKHRARQTAAGEQACPRALSQRLQVVTAVLPAPYLLQDTLRFWPL